MNKAKYVLTTLAAVSLLIGMRSAGAVEGTPVQKADGTDILKISDRARGGGLPGVTWRVRLVSQEKSDPERELSIKAVQTASLATTIEPARFKDSRLLQVDRNMWMSRPGLRKPIPISPRQKLSGQAAQGDIASTNYAVDYSGTMLREEAVNGEDCYVLDLASRNKFTTYDRITYWVSKERSVAVKADFLSLSGKAIKSATFEYGNVLSYDGKKYPFVSRMIIRDALTSETTTLEYSGVAVVRLPPSEFEVGRLGQ